MPPTIEGVPVKQVSTTCGARPMTSKICAPRYESTVEMPIFDITLSTPPSMAACSWFWAWVPSSSESSLRSASASTVSSARRGQIASAP